MAFNIDKALGIFPQSLELRGRKAEILSNNLANADTPNFMARDLDFKSVLAGMTGKPAVGNALPMAATDGQHANAMMTPDSINGLMYRIPGQPAIDGNTVDMHRERAEFLHNSSQWQASVTFLNSKIKGLMTAIKGGE